MHSVQNFEKITCHVQSKNKDQVLVIKGLLLESYPCTCTLFPSYVLKIILQTGQTLLLPSGKAYE